MTADPQRRRVGDAYIWSWPAPDLVEIEIDEVRRKGDDWLGWITVRTRAPGMAPHLAAGNHNLGAMQARTALARHLASRMADVDWPAFLEMACVLTVREEKEGEPFLEIGDRADREEPPYRLMPLVRDRQPTILFGDGGAGKSFLALFCALVMASGQAMCGFTPSNDTEAVGVYLDWETDEDEVDGRIKLLRRGHGVNFPNLFYRRELLPLHLTARQIRRFVDQKHASFVVVDSIGAACGGDPETADVVLRFFAAVRQLGVSVICVDHVTKAESGGKPFGSVYKHNAARMTFEMRKAAMPEEDTVHIGVYHRKSNNGRLLHPFGLALRFSDGAAQFAREDIPAEPELTKGLSASERIRLTLREAREAITVSDLVVRCDLTEATVRARLADLMRRDQVVKILSVGTQDAARYALKAVHEVAG